MSILRTHPDRYVRRQQLEAMDPVAQAHEVYRASAMLEFAWETRLGLNLAFYRTFAIPRIAAVLARTGEMAHHPSKRAFDTGLWMYELIEAGMDDARGREVVRGLNRMHHGWGIANGDFLYVLATFVVVPTRWIDQVGWRTTTAVERQAAAAFYARLGALMNIEGVPSTYEAFEDLFDAYEDRNIAYSDDGAAQMRATQQVIAAMLPRSLRFIGAGVTAAVLEDRLVRALGLAPASSGLRLLARAGLALRAARERRRAPRTASWFVPGRIVRGVYPEGYQLDQLGPTSARYTA